MTVLVLLAGCASSSSPQARQETPPASADILRIGLFPELPPIAFEQGRQFLGAEPDLGRQLAEHLGREARFVPLPWEDLIPALLADRIDIIMSGMSITDARRARVAFCNPWLRAGQSALIRRADYGSLRYGLPTGHYTVGTQRATTGDFFVEQNLTAAKRVPFRSPEEGVRALVNRKIDAFVHDLPINLWLASEHEADGVVVLDLLFTDEYLAWAVRPDRTELQAQVNAFLEKAKADGSLPELVRRWLPGYVEQSK